MVLWSRFGWKKIDTIGSPNLPPGRFILATTRADNQNWTIIGMCIPYAHYRNHEKWGDERKTFHQGACEYLDALSGEVLPRLIQDVFMPYSKAPFCSIMLGDFNLQIPPYRYPYPGSLVNQKRKAAFDGWLIPTAGISRQYIDHVAMSADLHVTSLQHISRFTADDKQLSDHNGVVIEIERGVF